MLQSQEGVLGAMATLLQNEHFYSSESRSVRRIWCSYQTKSSRESKMIEVGFGRFAKK